MQSLTSLFWFQCNVCGSWVQKLERKLKIAVAECHSYRQRMESALKLTDNLETEMQILKKVSLCVFLCVAMLHFLIISDVNLAEIPRTEQQCRHHER